MVTTEDRGIRGCRVSAADTRKSLGLAGTVVVATNFHLLEAYPIRWPTEVDDVR
jgi:hypothetical protein